MGMFISSPAFTHMGAIPQKHTCDGEDTSPQLCWGDVPANAQSLALILDDPDAPDPEAPKMTWVHWVLYNISSDTSGLAAAVTSATLPPEAMEGVSDWKHTGYAGPCPPVGTHRYFFKLFALDTALPDLGQPTKVAVEKAMEGHVVERAELVGVYRKS